MLECSAPVANRRVESIKGELDDVLRRLVSINNRLRDTKIRLLGNTSEEVGELKADQASDGHLSEIDRMVRDAHTSLGVVEHNLSEIEEAI